MSISLNIKDYNSEAEFLPVLDGWLSRNSGSMAKMMSLNIEHKDLFDLITDQFFNRYLYEIEFGASYILDSNSSPVTIPLTADMTFITSDQIQL